MLKIFAVAMIFGLMMTFGAEIGEQLAIRGAQNLVPTAEAVVGRPLTPVSVAGVARRSVRRCAAGVYNCQLPGSQSLERLIVHLDIEAGSSEASQTAASYRPVNCLNAVLRGQRVCCRFGSVLFRSGGWGRTASRLSLMPMPRMYQRAVRIR